MQKTLGKLARGERVIIVALGDSNTEVTWHTKGHLNWVGLLQEALFEKHGRGVAVTINAGHCGTTAAGSLERLEADVLRFQPDLVIVSFGMNDATNDETGLARFDAAMRTIVTRIREAGGEVLLRTPNPIVVSNQPGLTAGYKPGEVWPESFQHLMAKLTVELAKELECPVVDHYSLWVQARRDEIKEQPNQLWMRMSDAIHPDMLGHRVFYRELAPLFGLPTHFPWEE